MSGLYSECLDASAPSKQQANISLETEFTITKLINDWLPAQRKLHISMNQNVSDTVTHRDQSLVIGWLLWTN